MIRKTAALAAAWVACSCAQAIDGAAVELGRGNDRTSLLRVSVQDRWREDRFADTDWRFAGYWDISAALWDNREESTADLGITPVLRFERGTLYVEGAIGAHLVTRHISAHRVFSTAFQFGDHVGVGWRSGEYEAGIAFQHLSNAGIRHPNPGINFLLLRLRYRLP